MTSCPSASEICNGSVVDDGGDNVLSHNKNKV